MAKVTCVQTLTSPTPPSLLPSSSASPEVPFTPNGPSEVSSIVDSDTQLLSYLPNASKLSTDSTSPVWSCNWSSDGKRFVSCHGAPDACVRIWNSRCCKHLMRANKNRNNQNYHDEGTQEEQEVEWVLLATLKVDEDNVRINNKRRTIRAASFAPKLSPNIRYILAVASFDGTVSIWEDFSSHEPYEQQQSIFDSRALSNNGWECTAQLEGHENEIKDVTWNSTGTLLASCSRDKSVWIWECFLPGSIGGDGTGNRRAYGDSTGGEGEFECVAVLQGHLGDVKCIRFAPSHGQWGDGDDILLSSSYDDTIKCWAEDAGEWYCAATLSNVHESTIWSIALSPSGLRMISASADGSLAIWKCYTSSERKHLFPDETEKVVCSTDGLWKCVGKLPSAHNQLPIYFVHCASSKAGHGCFASAGADDSINIYSEAPGSTSDSPLFILNTSTSQAHCGDVNCIRWNPTDGTMLASVGDDGLIKIWRFDL